MHITAQALPVLLLVVVVVLPLQSALAKVKGHQQLIKEKGVFDTSLLPKHSIFKLRIKHTQILFPEDPEILLHGKGQIVTLGADKTDTLLHGRVAEDEHDSIINTHEYGVKPRFHVNLRRLAAKSAPEIAWLMQSEIEAGRLKVAAEVERDEQLMQRELRSRQPQTDLLPMPVPSSPSTNPSNKLESALAQSKQRAEQDFRRAIQQYEAAVSQGQGHLEKMPTNQIRLPPTNLASLPDRSIPSAAKTDTSAFERQMAEELTKAKLRAPLASDVNASLERAQNQAQGATRKAQPVMDMILTHLRPIPKLRIPTGTEVELAPQADTQSIIQWDAWHARFAQVARNPILQATGKCGTPPGVNTVEITVWPNHHIAVRLVKSGNVAFDHAILKAYQSLDGNTALEYPHGSRRSSVTFLIDNQHTGAGVPSALKSETSVGDQEILHYHR